MKKILFLLCVFQPLWLMGQNYSTDLLRSAEAGDSNAMLDLGWCYENSKGIAQDYDMAIHWYTKAAKKGNTIAMANLGLCYEYGRGVPQDYIQAVYWFQKGADKADARCQVRLALCYSGGRGVNLDAKQAIKLLQSASKANYAPAMFELGLIYENGEITQQNLTEAVKWYRKSADLGESDAMTNLALCYELGKGLPKDFSMAAHWYRKGVNAGNGISAHNLGLLYEHGKGVSKNLEEAFRLYQKSADLEFGNGMFRVGLCYELGIGVNKNIQLAVKWYRKGAESGNGLAACNLAILYEHGNGVPQDNMQAYYWYEQAAQLGNIYAMNDLGRFLSNGQGVKQDVTSALYWYRQSANGGNPGAMNNIGLCYEDGLGVSQNLTEAIKWYRKGAEGGNPQAFINLSRCFREGIGVTVNLPKSDLLIEGCGAAKLNNFKRSNELLAQVFGEDVISNSPATEQQGNEVAEEKNEKVISSVDINLPKTDISRPNTFAVIIANENYFSESKVDFAHNDGSSIKNYLEQVIGLPASNIHFVKDATLNMIRREVNWLTKVAKSYNGKASILFYYAGHGIPDVKKSTSYLLPSDGAANDIVTGFALDDLYSQLAASPTRSTLVFLDACFSGAQRNGESMNAVRAVGIRAKQGVPRGNMVVFSATQGNETAHPYQAEQHGMFTYFLLKKIKEKQGKVTLGELGDYVRDEVCRKSTIEFTEGQTPSIHVATQMADSWKKLYLGE